MAIRTLIVNTRPAGRTGEESLPPAGDADRPDLYVDYETRRGFQRPMRIPRPGNPGEIPEGMEGFYYLP